MEEFQFKSNHVWAQQQSEGQDMAHYDKCSENIIMSQSQKFQKLKMAKERFTLFIKELKHEAYTPLRHDVLAYCQTQKKSLEQKIKPDGVIRKIEIRIEKMLKTKRIKRNWGTQDLCILIWIISKYCNYKGIQNLQKDIVKEDWDFIASLIPGVSGQSCMFKWLSIKKITLANHNWTKKQSEQLADIVKQKIDYCDNGQIKDWKEISQILYRCNNDHHKVYRNAKQCRQHWTCYLSPQLKKGPWQMYQDIKLLKFIKDNKGLKKWSQIAKFFEGRTENALKNRYTLIIQKQKKPAKNRHKSQLQLISQFLQKCYVDQFTSNIKFQEEEESIYQDDLSKDRYIIQEISNKIPFIKKQDGWHDNTKQPNQVCITPMRVQKFNINDFQAMSLTFFRSIQPGVMDSDGNFKKIQNTNIKLVKGDSIQHDIFFLNSEKCRKFDQE